MLTGAVLCGGKSARMGCDKALLELSGRSLIERAVAVLEPLSSRVLLACGSSERYPDMGLPLVLDQRRNGGPLAGLEAALAATSTPWLAVLACDMPGVSPVLFEELLRHSVAGDLDVCILAGERGLEPLCGVYHKRCLAPVRAALDHGERRMISFHGYPLAGLPQPRAELRVAELAERELLLALGLAEEGRLTANLNTPEELARERELRRMEGTR